MSNRTGWRTIAAAACLLVTAGGAQAASLTEELSDLVTTHPQIKAAEDQVSAAEKGIRVAWAAFMPRVDLAAGAGYEHITNPTLRTTPSGESALWTENWNVTLTQNLWDGLAKYSGKRMAEINEGIARDTLDTTVQNVLFEGTAAYLDVLRQKELIALSEQNADNIRTQLNLEDERVRRGSGIAVDVLQAKTRLQLAQERLVFVSGAYEDSQTRYQQVYNKPAPFTRMAVPVPPVHLVPPSVDGAVDVALDENPALAIGNKLISLADETREVTRAEYWPRIDFVARGNYESDFNATPGIRRDYSFKVQAAWNLFDGFSKDNRIDQAAHTYAARQNELLFTRRKTEEAVRLAWQARLTNDRRVELLENAMNIAAEVFEARKKLREAGEETVINVLDSENEVFNSRINYTSAAYDARTAVYQLLLSMGRLNLTTIDQLEE